MKGTEVMPTSDLVARLNEVSGVSKANISAVLRAFPEVVFGALIEGKTVDLGRGFGKMRAVERAPLRRRVPSRPEEILEIPPARKIKFTPSPAAMKTLPALDDKG